MSEIRKNLYIVNENKGTWEQIAELVTREEAEDVKTSIFMALEEWPQYLRYWNDENGNEWCDYGSWSKFIVWGFENVV